MEIWNVIEAVTLTATIFVMYALLTMVALMFGFLVVDALRRTRVRFRDQHKEHRITTYIRHRPGRCAHCHHDHFFFGPDEGGLAIRVICGNPDCRHVYRWTEVINDLQDLHEVTPREHHPLGGIR
jgi:hypothetical protein